MWIHAIIALIYIGGSTCSESVDCIQRVKDECDESQFPSEFPKSTDELEESCSAVQDLLKCATKTFHECGGDEEDLEFMVDSHEFVNQACDPNSRTYKAVSNNLECLNSAVPAVYSTCYFSEKKQDIQNALETRELNNDYRREEVTDCFNAMWLHACTALVVGDECGDDVADAAVDIFINLDIRLMQCPSDVQDELMFLIPSILDIAYVEDDVENTLPRKKK